MSVKPSTVLTNLQRGNVKQEIPLVAHQRTIHELAAQGELYNIEPHLVNTLDCNNMTPLHWAAGYGQSSTVELLLRNGANSNLKSNGDRTALMFAAARGFYHVVKILIADGADVNAVDVYGNSALMYATHQDHPPVVQELLREGSDLSIVNLHNQTAYSIALSSRRGLAQALIEAHLLSKFDRSGPVTSAQRY